MLGPADVIYKSFEYCETKITNVDLWISTKKYNRTTNLLDITLITPWKIDNDLILEVTAEVKKDGGYKPGQFHMKDPFCKVCSTILGDVFTQFLQAAGKDDCPVADGKYDIKDFYLDNEKMTVPQLYGDYRAHLQFYRGEELKGCYYLFVDMVPKKESIITSNY
ncbi:uncharacterized protein LOC125231998 [Leguminivora glycinivorella]|uniref:uncharacterized protein LOC125231998 n=1 Tax=Leguminivora glycinivorella TaxID=1035111 RepID=UPI00200DFEB4|nr:uncharacterized protein LOC125231998 [Leguminivora glycinivorella]